MKADGSKIDILKCMYKDAANSPMLAEVKALHLVAETA